MLVLGYNYLKIKNIFMKKYCLIPILLIGVFVISGCQKQKPVSNQALGQNIQNQQAQQNQGQSEPKAITGKNSEEIMKKILKNENQTVEIYKIFEEIQSPYDVNVKAVLFGLDKSIIKECCSHPTAIFINNNGTQEGDYVVLQGSLNNMSIKNVKWVSDKQVSYDQIQMDEAGDRSVTKYLNVYYIEK